MARAAYISSIRLIGLRVNYAIDGCRASRRVLKASCGHICVSCSPETLDEWTSWLMDGWIDGWMKDGWMEEWMIGG